MTRGPILSVLIDLLIMSSFISYKNAKKIFITPRAQAPKLQSIKFCDSVRTEFCAESSTGTLSRISKLGQIRT